MSKDIHKWTDGRYTLMFDEHTFFVFDNENEERMTALEVTKKLNEQEATISALRTENNHLIDVIKEYAKKYEEQQATINELQGQINRLNYIIEELRKNNYNKFELINKMKKEEKLYAEEIVRLNNEIGELRETNKEWLEFKELGGDY